MRLADRSSPLPLYHQIAERIRRAIAQGELQPGDRLEPLREAAQRLGVHHHTVRHAYAELAREGLLHSDGPKGTHIASGAHPRAVSKRESLAEFIEQCVQRAREVHGISAAEFANFLTANPATPESLPRAHVIECSHAQTLDLCRQLSSFWQVDALPLCLNEIEELPAGVVVGTYFHYNEFRVRWPQRLNSIQFLSIRPDPTIAKTLSRKRGRAKKLKLALCEYDEPTAMAVAADLSAVLDTETYSIQTHVVTTAAALKRGGKRGVVLYPPRVWNDLAESERRMPDAIELRYVFERQELLELGRTCGWRRSDDNGR